MAMESHILQALMKESGGMYATSDVSEAYSFCARVASAHYENFPVASRLLRPAVRPHITAVYAFARLADDIADELDVSSSEKIRRLKELLGWISTGKNSTHPVVRAIVETMRDCGLPMSLPERLITAFSMDSDFCRPRTWQDLLEYCRFSANPIGETVLRIHGIHEPQLIEYSNSICTALQLINFWQDQSLDHARARCYVPEEITMEHGLAVNVSASAVTLGIGDDTSVQGLKRMYTTLFDRTLRIMNSGRPLLRGIHDVRLRAELSFIIESASRILERCSEMHEELLHKRPTLGLADMPLVLFRSIRSYVI